jgi:hypothetical protein
MGGAETLSMNDALLERINAPGKDYAATTLR